MATGLSGRMISSEETFDFTCSQCYKKDRVKEAVKYCHDCHKYLCTSCVEQHNDYMEDHILVEPSAAGGGVVMPTEKCRRHQRRVELWCKKHDEVLCTMCAFMEHRFCEEVKLIPGSIDELLQDTELQETVSRLKRIRERLATVKRAQLLVGEELLKEKNKYLDMIVQERENIILIVKSLGKAAEEEINGWYDEKKSKLNEYQNCCGQIEEDTSACIQQMETACKNKPQLFVSMKKGQKLILTATDFVAKNENDARPEKVYEMNKKIQENLAALESLGSFQNIIHLYKPTSKTNVSIKTAKDLETCDVEGTCRLSDCSVIMIDYKNRRLKRLDSSKFTVTDYCDLPHSPLAVCCVGHQEVAVCYGSSNMIQFVSVGTTIALARSFTVGHSCRGICHRNEELFVSDGDKNVHVYNMSGTPLRTISHTQSGEALFSGAKHMTVIGDRIYIADWDRGLICIDRNGTELFRYKGALVNGGQAACTDGKGGVFLCGYNSHNVIQIGVGGEELGVVLTRADGLVNPQSVCFDPSQRKLIVTMNRNEIRVFDLL